MSVIDIPAVRWASGLLSGGAIAVAAFVAFDGTTQLALYAMAAFALVSEPIVLGWMARQQ
ncbi:MAG: hypothetical protein ABEH88_06860 [Halobacteriales archaeon]